VYNVDMAEENRAKRASFEDLMFMMFAALIVTNALNRIPVLLEEHLGISVGNTSTVASVALSADTPKGSAVNTPNGTAYYATPGATEEDGTFAPGTSLFLSDGPETVGKERWWYVEDTAGGGIGWVPESALVREGAGGLTAQTKPGTTARTVMDVSLWDLPGSGRLSGTAKKSEMGELSAGPTEARGSRWWFFDRAESDEDGWVTESALMLGSENNWRPGSRVQAENDTDLFERAGGGRAVGVLAEGETAKVLGGPVSVGNAYWWLIQKKDGTEGWVAESVLVTGGLIGWVKGAVAFLILLGTIATVALLAGIMYVAIRTNQIRAKETRRIKEAIPKAMKPKRNERWDTVLLHVSSDNPNDWRLAIIEADVMLDELVSRMGYMGTSLGDRLKQVARGDMRTLDAAWEAHRVRNQVAHAGSDFILTKREARRVIDLYGAVFGEFKFI
jgi:hypothetical protein